MPRFFIKKEDIADGVATIRNDDAFHIARALRLAVGDEITVCDECADTYLCRLLFIRDDEVKAEILRQIPSTESPLSISLFMGYPKGDKLETVVQKSVELGARRVIPFISTRCVKRPDEKGEKKAQERLCRIAEEAAKQCGRSTLTEIGGILSFEEMLDVAKNADLPLFCYEGDGCLPLPVVLNRFPESKSVSVIVGSEGGFSPAEAAAARERGFQLVNLGPRILRCETAPSFVLSALCYHYELQK